MYMSIILQRIFEILWPRTNENVYQLRLPHTISMERNYIKEILVIH